jgi:hypothetical protein
MSWDEKHGCESPGKIGTATHRGTPLTVEQIKALEPGTRIVVTWGGGSGPWEGTVVHDEYYGVSYTNEREAGPHALLRWPETQVLPLNRVTLAAQPDHAITQSKWWAADQEHTKADQGGERR